MKTEMKKESVETLFTEAVAGLKSCSIDEVVEAVENNPDLMARIIPIQQTRSLLKQQCRRLMKKTKDEYGFSRFMSVRVVSEDGTETRKYKQPQLFDKSEYQQTIDYYGHLALHYANTTVELRNRCEAKFGIQIPLPFDEDGFRLD